MHTYMKESCGLAQYFSLECVFKMLWTLRYCQNGQDILSARDMNVMTKNNAGLNKTNYW